MAQKTLLTTHAICPGSSPVRHMACVLRVGFPTRSVLSRLRSGPAAGP
ncbi:hypothetical protein KPATCC21470_5766 [Kitasatospora purpeofusca]